MVALICQSLHSKKVVGLVHGPGKIACSPRACVGSVQLLWLPIGFSKLSVGVCGWVNVFCLSFNLMSNVKICDDDCLCFNGSFFFLQT